MHLVDWSNPVDPDAPLNDGLVAWWVVGDDPLWGGPRLYDLAAPNANHLTLTNSPTWRGNLGMQTHWGCLDFVGSSSQYLAGTSPVSSGPCTITAWFRTTSSANQAIVTLRDGGSANYFGLGVNALAVYSFINAASAGNVSTTATGTTASGQWTHGAAVFASATSRTVYRDGQNAASNATSRAPTGTTVANVATFATASSFLTGQVAAVRVYNRALSAAEVAAEYDAGLDGYQRELRRPPRPLPYVYEDVGGGVVIPVLMAHYRNNEMAA